MSQSEQLLTPEDREALPGFAAPAPRRVQRKAEQNQPKGLVDIGCLSVLSIVASVFGALAFFIPTLRINIAIGVGVFLGLIGLLILSALPQALLQKLKHWYLARHGVAVVARVSKREIHSDMGSQGPYGWTDYVFTCEFQVEEGRKITGTFISSEDKYRENGPILIIYNPKNPKDHQAFSSLMYEPLA
jgi:hypothetical protein